MSQYKQDEIVFMPDILAEQSLVDDLVAVDADAMSRDLETYGKVALYGIFFDHDKATIKAESKPALDEIAKLLKQQKDLQLYVVGHTDMTGSLAYNRKLSQDRATTVVDALVGQYAIASNRLAPHGLGPLVPGSTNASENGRGKNRRVELVQK